jgi:hypothetical protein
MPKVIRPRHQFPTPLFKLTLPVLLVAPVALWYLGALTHGTEAAVALVVATACCSPLVLLARTRVAVVSAVLSAALLGWIAELVLLLALHPPE